MKKHILVSVLALLLFSYGQSQNFTLNPRTVNGVATCAGVTAFQVGLTNNSGSALYLSYSLISNTLPDTTCWTQVLCDCNICHPDNFIPSFSPCIDSIAIDSTKLDFMIYDVKDSKGHIGSGTIKYLVYETANPTNNDTLTFNITGCTTGAICATSINENSLEQITVFPSVTNDKIYIKQQGNIQHLESIAIYDCIGRIVYSEKNIELTNNKKAITVSTLPDGVYFIKLDESGHSLTKKFVKSN